MQNEEDAIRMFPGGFPALRPPHFGEYFPPIHRPMVDGVKL
jgi:hypothetical protein